MDTISANLIEASSCRLESWQNYIASVVIYYHRAFTKLATNM